MEKLHGLPRLQAEFPLVFELAARIRRDLAEIDETTALDIRRMMVDGAPDQDLDERHRRGRMMGEALRQELEAINRNLSNILAAYEPAPFVIPADALASMPSSPIPKP